MDKPANSLVVAIDNKADFNKRLQETRTNSKLLVLEFTAGWNEPCKAMKPTVEGFASQFKDSADFCTVDVEVNEFQEVARGAKVEALPTFLLVKSGKVVSRVVGVKAAELQDSINEALQSDFEKPQQSDFEKARRSACGKALPRDFGKGRRSDIKKKRPWQLF